MKLNISPPITPDPKKPSPDPGISPVGWWNVSTQGDCEGRSTRQLGEHFGHVAEIALSLTEPPYYSYEFMAISDRNPPTVLPTFQAVRKSAWIYFSDYKINYLRHWMEKWLDCDDLTITNTGKGGEQYFRSTYITMKGW